MVLEYFNLMIMVIMFYWCIILFGGRCKVAWVEGGEGRG